MCLDQLLQTVCIIAHSEFPKAISFFSCDFQLYKAASAPVGSVRPFQIPISTSAIRSGTQRLSNTISNSHWSHSSHMQSLICLLSSEPRAAWYSLPTAPRLVACSTRLIPLNSLVPTQHFDSSHFCSGFTSCVPRC